MVLDHREPAIRVLIAPCNPWGSFTVHHDVEVTCSVLPLAETLASVCAGGKELLFDACWVDVVGWWMAGFEDSISANCINYQLSVEEDLNWRVDFFNFGWSRVLPDAFFSFRWVVWFRCWVM